MPPIEHVRFLRICPIPQSEALQDQLDHEDQTEISTNQAESECSRFKFFFSRAVIFFLLLTDPQKRSHWEVYWDFPAPQLDIFRRLMRPQAPRTYPAYLVQLQTLDQRRSDNPCDGHG